MELSWHPYKYFEYEYALAMREVEALLAPQHVVEGDSGLYVSGATNGESLVRRLVYFASARDEDTHETTLQRDLESGANNGHQRQATRYSVHGFHEYKGKFNPQIVRAILNILNVPENARVLDPFCGSGTTLVGSAHIGIESVGLDVNPLAVFIANAKLEALSLDVAIIRREAEQVVAEAFRLEGTDFERDDANDLRLKYLQSWFDSSILLQIEQLRFLIEKYAPASANVLFTIASNLLRDYSQQDPKDLRIRRRKTPLPSTPFLQAFQSSVCDHLTKLAAVQNTIGVIPPRSKAYLSDSRDPEVSSRCLSDGFFSCVITSPPYATALPYIDTQRLSLVWLGLVASDRILSLESELIGSRELRGVKKSDIIEHLLANTAELPDRQAALCRELLLALGESDGFRRQAVPVLLYRYFRDMAQVFESVRRRVRAGTPFALVVGRNHTTLSGKRYSIDTPKDLAEIAQRHGWTHSESIELNTYPRYGYHMRNAVSSEQLVILRAK